jgi:outer membrane protein TolC
MNTASGHKYGRWLPAAKISVGLLPLILGGQIEVAKAQTAPSGSQRLTLRAAVDLALKQNLEIQVANIETALRLQDRVIARSDLLPHAGFAADGQSAGTT